MRDSEGHNYFFPIPLMPWKENKMALLDAQTEARLKSMEDRLDEIERILAILLEEQEDAEDAVHDETA